MENLLESLVENLLESLSMKSFQIMERITSGIFRESPRESCKEPLIELPSKTLEERILKSPVENFLQSLLENP